MAPCWQAIGLPSLRARCRPSPQSCCIRTRAGPSSSSGARSSRRCRPWSMSTDGLKRTSTSLTRGLRAMSIGSEAGSLYVPSSPPHPSHTSPSASAEVSSCGGAVDVRGSRAYGLHTTTMHSMCAGLLECGVARQMLQICRGNSACGCDHRTNWRHQVRRHTRLYKTAMASRILVARTRSHGGECDDKGLLDKGLRNKSQLTQAQAHTMVRANG
mmetsp:Transcript_31517/g.96421  ORF Transcript_31517/g.96421 Transcript_31517/m.96421 type:complete len:214 (-) Transcript_31517:84-725(-)